MKFPALLSILALGCLAALGLRAAEPAANIEAAATTAPLTTAQIDELLAPIALYPDPLVAIILPASTFPADIVMAARYLDAKRDPDAIDNQPWDDSVKSLARYPDVVKWMDENLEWTRQLGVAFTLQPAALLTGTQRLRAAAIAAGHLKTTPEQTVIVEKEVVRIVPARREVIFVPVYDPYWVYRPWPAHTYHHPRPVITFSSGYHTGLWLSYHFNWGSSSIVIVSRPYRSVVWHNYSAWHYPSHTVVHHHHVWHPAPVVVQQVRRDYQRRPVTHIAQPATNIHVQRNVTRDVTRDVNINRTREFNRDREVNRPANANAPTPAPRREITTRAPEEFHRQTRPESLETSRDVIRRPATNAPVAVRTERTPNEHAQRTQPGLRAPDAVRPAPENRVVVATPRPAPSRPALTPSQNPERPRAAITPPAPQTQTAPRVRPAPADEMIRTPRPAPQIEPRTIVPRPTQITPAPTVAATSAPVVRMENARRATPPSPTPPVTQPMQPGIEEPTARRGFHRAP